MSAINITITAQDLVKPDFITDEYTEYVKSFLVRLKFALAYRLGHAYNIPYSVAMNLVILHAYGNGSYTLGIESASNYPVKYRQVVQLLLEKDIGSISKKIVGKNLISSFCNYVSSNVTLLWLDFLNKKAEET